LSEDAASNLALTRTGRWNERPDGAGVSDVDLSRETHLFLGSESSHWKGEISASRRNGLRRVSIDSARCVPRE